MPLEPPCSLHLFLLGSTGFLEEHRSCRFLSAMMTATGYACHISRSYSSPFETLVSFLDEGNVGFKLAYGCVYEQ